MELSRRHRGPDPEDERSFGPKRLATLREATGDLCWLLDRGYGIASATELVGDRYRLSRRQRIAIARCACSKAARERRQEHRVAPNKLRGQELWLDGFNVLTAVETALGGGVILIGRDGCCRDVAGIYSRYHKVAETVPALRAIESGNRRRLALGSRTGDEPGPDPFGSRADRVQFRSRDTGPVSEVVQPGSRGDHPLRAASPHCGPQS